ncbi:MAG: NUDIX domain-containing protein [Anaerolineae bacterium]|nr:NUDIX domain-containing protein [Anaerolineae bacterium]
MAKHKAFAYVVRTDRTPPQLLVMASTEGPGFEVVRGKQDLHEIIAETAAREVAEEAGLTNCVLGRELGIVRWQNEIQHFFLFYAPDGLPDAYEHTVNAPDAGDHGQVFSFSWLPISLEIEGLLVQGSGRFLTQLVEAMQR